MQYFTSSLQLVFETHAPQIEKRVYGRPCPWLDIDTKKLMNRRNQTLRNTRKSNSNDYWKSYKILRKKCNKQIKKAELNHPRKRSMLTSVNQRNFGHILKTFFLEHHYQWQTYQLINVLV